MRDHQAPIRFRLQPLRLAIPASIAALGLIVTLCVWRLAVAQERVELHREVALDVQKMKAVLALNMRDHVQSIVRLTREWEKQGRPDPRQWGDSVRLVLGEDASLRSVAWTDAQSRIQHVASPPGDEPLKREDLASVPLMRQAEALAKERHQVALSLPPEKGSETPTQLFVFVPVFQQSRFAGFVIAGFNLPAIFHTIFSTDNGLSIDIRHGDELLYRRGEFLPRLAPWNESAVLDLFGSNWRVEAQPTPELLKLRRSYVSPLVLVSGAVMSLLLALSVALGLDARRRALALAKAQQQLEDARSASDAKVVERTAELSQALEALSLENAERTRSEEALHESVARFRAMSDASPLGIIVTDIMGTCVYSNPRFQAMVGVSPEEAAGQLWDVFLHPDDRESASQKWIEDVRRHRTYEHSFRLLRSDRVVWATMKAAPIHDGRQFSGYVAVIEDVTEQRANERRLEESEKRYRALADAIPQMVWTADSNGFLDYYNQRWIDYTGMTSEQTQIEGWKTVLHPDDFELCSRLWRESIKTGQVFQIEYRLKNIRDGRFRWHLGRALPWRDASGKIIKWFGSCTDIDDQKRLQMELVDAKQAAEAAARAKTSFLANISHEIRTPINGIIGTTDLLWETELSSEQREFADILRTSGESLLSIVNDLLDLSKIEAGKLTIERQEIDVARTVESAIVLFKERLHLRKLELSTFFEPTMPALCRGDAVRIRQVLINLLSNAIKYTERGGVALTVSSEPAGETPAHLVLRFEIRDTGIGISPEQQANLFQPFYQADSSASRAYGGTGLGLAISKQLVQMMGGTLGFKSALGQGSTFWFSVPMEKVETQPPAPSLKGKRILVVEASDMNRAAILQQLAAWGAEGQAVEDAAHALTAMRQAAHKGKPFDFALANWWLPKMDGLSLAQSVHGDPELKNTKIVLMASLAHHLWTKELESAHVSGFVSKPLLYSQLFAVLSSAESVSALAVQGAPPIAARRRKDESLIRVLLAEDNMVNQTVTVRQLERLGYACDSVGNGREVLQALRRARYDVVLMDLQMPEMDGYQTTVEIRRREKSAHTIIIAMTAHALKEDRERCLASGMDDYISKPVKTAELAAVLERWAPSNRAPAPPGVASAPPAPGGVVPRVDPEQFSATLGAEGADQASLLKLYLESTAANLQEISGAMATNDWPTIERVAHSSAGANAMVGMKKMAQLLRRLEQSAREGNPAVLAPLFSDLQKEFAEVKIYLAKNSEPQSGKAMA